jgi:hypothetical protein
VPPSLIAGRTVFVGLTAPGLGPAFPTPVTPDAGQHDRRAAAGQRAGRPAQRPDDQAGRPWARVAFALSLLWLLLAGLLVLPPRANLVLLLGLCLPWR